MTRSAHNSNDYTAEQYIADLVDVLPGAMPYLHEIDLLTTCAHCGGPYDGRGGEVHWCSENGEITDVEIVAVCGRCLSGPMLPPEEWQHVGPTSGLFYIRDCWAEAVRMLRWAPVLYRLRGPFMIIGGD